MLTIEEISNIKDNDLKRLLMRFYSMRPTDKDIEFYSNLYTNEEDNAMQMKYDLANLLYRRMANEELIKAFSMDDNFKYKKRLDISDNLLLTKPKDDYYHIYEEITGDYSIWRDYDVLISFIKDQGIEFDKDLETNIKNFILPEKHQVYINRKKSIYLPFMDERKNLRHLLRAEKATTYYDENLKTKRNKTLGNVGEYYTDDFLRLLERDPYFISKDYGDGFGFDHHYVLAGNEKLVESKATVKEDETTDSFLITDNEYSILKDCLGNDYRSYLVARVFIDRETIGCRKINILHAEDDKVFFPLNYGTEDDYTYEFDHEEKNGVVFTKKIK